MITALEEVMTEDIELPDGYTVITQTETGVNNVQTDESGEKHAVLLFELKFVMVIKSRSDKNGRIR